MEIKRSQVLFLIAVVAVLVLGVYLRTGLLRFQGLFEPDGFFHYSIIEQTLANGLAVPKFSAFSGFPSHNLVTEPLGLYYMTIVPYLLLGKSIGVLQIMRLIPILFGVLDAIGAFFLVMYLFRDRLLGLIAMFMVAVSSGDIARTGATVYRGDGFITIFMIVSLILLIKAFREKNLRGTALFGLASSAVIGIGTVVWGGAPFMVFVYMIAVLLVVIYAFITADTLLLGKGFLLSAAILLEYLIQHFWMYIGGIRGSEALSSLHFFLFYLPLVAGSWLAFFIVQRRDRLPGFTMNSLRRAETVLSILIIGFVLVFVLGGSYIGNIASGGGLVIAGNSLTKSIQELQPPSLSFIWGSFGFQLPLAVLGILLFLFASENVLSVESILRTRKESHLIEALKDGILPVKNVLRSGKISIGMSVSFLVLLSYILLTGYLQANAIRFNSIVAVPIAMFAAYAVYALLKIFEKRYGSIPKTGVALVALPVSIYMFGSIIAILFGKLGFGIYFNMIPALIIAAIFALIASWRFGRGKLIVCLYIGIVALILSYSAVFAYVQMVTAGQADGINPSFLSAMSWLGNNTPANATILAIWPDGSVIEGWAHRQSSTDSVNGQNAGLIKGFASFVFNDTPDTQYLTNTTHMPQYLVARYYWLSEYGGILLESGINNTPGIRNTSDYAIYQFLGASVLPSSTQNSISYYFVGNGNDNATMDITSSNGIISVNSSIHNSTTGAPVAHTILYNENASTYQEFNSTGNKIYNGTLFVSFYIDQQGHSTITQAYMMGQALANSNMVKFLFLCGASSCTYGNSSVRAKLIYQNTDTRIFKLNYS